MYDVLKFAACFLKDDLRCQNKLGFIHKWNNNKIVAVNNNIYSIWNWFNNLLDQMMNNVDTLIIAKAKFIESLPSGQI